MSESGQKLQKTLSSAGLFSLAFGTIIGVGWITVLGAWLADAGSLGAIAAFVFGGLVMLAMALCYAEVAGMYPVSGGEVAYIYKMYGERMGFAAGWLLAYLYISATAFEAISVGWVLSAMFPAIDSTALYRFMGAEVKLWPLLIGLLIMAAITLINLRGAKSTALFQNIMTTILIIAVVVFVFGGMLKANPANLEPLFVGYGAAGAFSGFLIVLATTPFWFAGFDTIPQAMGEIANEATLKKIPLVMTAAVILATVFYVVVILTTALSVERNIVLGAELPLAAAIEAALGPVGKQFVLFAGLCGLITTWNAVFYAASRILFAMGRARMIPHGFGAVSARFSTPANAVVFVGLAGGLASFMGREAIGLIVGASALVFSLLLFLVAHGAARLRKIQPDYPRPYRFPGGLPSLRIVTALAFAIFALSLISPLMASGGGIPHEWTTIGVWSILGAVFWIIAAPMRGKLEKRERRQIVLNESG